MKSFVKSFIDQFFFVCFNTYWNELKDMQYSGSVCVYYQMTGYEI